MKKEEDKKKKIYRYLDNLYSKSEVEDIANLHSYIAQNKKNISKKQEYYCIKSKENNSDSENRYGEQLHAL